MKRSRLVQLVAAVLIAGVPSLSEGADFPAQSTYQPPINRVAAAWQGFYAGVEGGYTWGNYSAVLTPGPTAFDTSGSSLSGGVFAGMNFQVAPQFVAGVEGDINFMDAKASQLLFGVTYTARTDWQGTIRARAGVTFDNVFVYGTGGLAIANIEFAGPLASSESTRVGWALGFGAEAKVTDNIFARAEYLYANYGSSDYGLGLGSNIHGDLDTHTIRVGVGYRF